MAVDDGDRGMDLARGARRADLSPYPATYPHRALSPKGRPKR